MALVLDRVEILPPSFAPAQPTYRADCTGTPTRSLPGWIARVWLRLIGDYGETGIYFQRIDPVYGQYSCAQQTAWASAPVDFAGTPVFVDFNVSELACPQGTLCYCLTDSAEERSYGTFRIFAAGGSCTFKVLPVGGPVDIGGVGEPVSVVPCGRGGGVRVRSQGFDSGCVELPTGLPGLQQLADFVLSIVGTGYRPCGAGNTSRPSMVATLETVPSVGRTSCQVQPLIRDGGPAALGNPCFVWYDRKYYPVVTGGPPFGQLWLHLQFGLGTDPSQCVRLGPFQLDARGSWNDASVPTQQRVVLDFNAYPSQTSQRPLFVSANVLTQPGGYTKWEETWGMFPVWEIGSAWAPPIEPDHPCAWPPVGC